MTISLGAGPFTGTGASGGSSFTISLTSLTAGRSVVIQVRWEMDLTITSITLTGETVDIHGTRTRNASVAQSYQYASVKKLASGGSKTLTITFSGSGLTGHDGGWCREVDGLDVNGSVILDIEGGATGNSTNGTVSITTTVPNCFILTGNTNTAAEPTVPGGYTTTNLANLNWFDNGGTNLDVGAAGSKATTWTHASGQWVVKSAAFRPAVAAQGLPPPQVGRQVYVMP